MTTPRWINTETVARVLGICRQTVRNYVAAGYLQAMRTGGGHFRFDRSEVEEFKRRMSEPMH